MACFFSAKLSTCGVQSKETNAINDQPQISDEMVRQVNTSMVLS